VEVLASVEKKMGDQAEGTGSEPVLEAAETMLGEQAMGIGEPVRMEDRSGEEPNLMEVDQVVRTGGEPVHEAVEVKTGAEPVPEDVTVGTGDIPVREVGEGDLHSEDYCGDDFEKVGEYSPEEPSQSPLTPAPEHPTEETRSSAKPQRKRFKTLAGWTDLPCVRKLIALKAKSSSSSKQPPQKQPSQPTRKSYRLAGQGGVRSSSTNQGPPVIEKIPSLSEGSPMKTPEPVVVP